MTHLHAIIRTQYKNLKIVPNQYFQHFIYDTNLKVS